MTRRWTRLAVAPAAVASALLLPAGAGAASVSVTGDTGQPIALDPAAPTQIRNMSPQLAPAFTAAEKRYRLTITGPDGATAASGGTTCSSTSSVYPETLRFLGNGVYTATLQVGTDADDFQCAKLGAPVAYAFTIAASTAVTAPGAKLLMRKPLSTSSLPYTFAVAVNPGADDIEVRYARRATLAPDGGIAGDPARASVDTAAGTTSLTFTTPGTYTFVSRAVDYGTNAATPWSAPVTVKVYAPFDFVSEPYFADSRGPSYTIKGTVRERSASGRIRVYLAKGRKGGKFRRIGRVRIHRDQTFSVRFKQSGRGRYRIKYVFKGSSTVAGGSVTQLARIKRVAF